MQFLVNLIFRAQIVFCQVFNYSIIILEIYICQVQSFCIIYQDSNYLANTLAYTTDLLVSDLNHLANTNDKADNFIKKEV